MLFRVLSFALLVGMLVSGVIDLVRASREQRPREVNVDALPAQRGNVFATIEGTAELDEALAFEVTTRSRGSVTNRKGFVLVPLTHAGSRPVFIEVPLHELQRDSHELASAGSFTGLMGPLPQKTAMALRIPVRTRPLRLLHGSHPPQPGVSVLIALVPFMLLAAAAALATIARRRALDCHLKWSEDRETAWEGSFAGIQLVVAIVWVVNLLWQRWLRDPDVDSPGMVLGFYLPMLVLFLLVGAVWANSVAIDNRRFLLRSGLSGVAFAVVWSDVAWTRVKPSRISRGSHLTVCARSGARIAMHLTSRAADAALDVQLAHEVEARVPLLQAQWWRDDARLAFGDLLMERTSLRVRVGGHERVIPIEQVVSAESGRRFVLRGPKGEVLLTLPSGRVKDGHLLVPLIERIRGAAADPGEATGPAPSSISGP